MKPLSSQQTAPAPGTELETEFSDRRLIFLFGLPRSGTTLVQRILSQSPDVFTVSEPWVLLPLMQPLRATGTRSDYGYQQFSHAFDDLPIDEEDYRRAIRQASLTVYGRILQRAGATGKFLDKTPRYHLIAEEIMRTFPESRAVVIWRNPLAVAASIMSTWNRGAWNLYNYHVDLYDGARALANLCRNFPERLQIVRYEDLVIDPEDVCSKLFASLDLDFSTDMVEQGTRSRLEGRMGDKRGQNAYETVSSSSLDRYRSAFMSPWRKRWARHYLDWLGPDTLAEMGYAPSETYDVIERAGWDLRQVVSDPLRRLWGAIVLWADIDAFREQRRRRAEGLPPVRYR